MNRLGARNQAAQWDEQTDADDVFAFMPSHPCIFLRYPFDHLVLTPRERIIACFFDSLNLAVWLQRSLDAYSGLAGLEEGFVLGLIS